MTISVFNEQFIFLFSAIYTTGNIEHKEQATLVQAHYSVLS